MFLKEYHNFYEQNICYNNLYIDYYNYSLYNHYCIYNFVYLNYLYIGINYCHYFYNFDYIDEILYISIFPYLNLPNSLFINPPYFTFLISLIVNNDKIEKNVIEAHLDLDYSFDVFHFPNEILNDENFDVCHYFTPVFNIFVYSSI